VWNLDIGKMVHTLEGHELSLFGVAVTPDGRLAVSASADWLCWTIMPSHGEHRAVFRKLTSGYFALATPMFSLGLIAVCL
jgi:WD40 repeat protein